MAFLDRMVSNMVRRHTGFNPRRIVRRVGGKKILMLGGAALLGGMMAQSSHKKFQAAGSGAGGTQLPPSSGGGSGSGLPPLPRTSEANTLPPLPGMMTAEEDDGPDNPPELVYAAVRTMVAGSLADGVLDDDEKRLIDEQLGDSSLSHEQAEQIRRDLVVPATPSELAALLPEGEEPETLAQFALLVVGADGERAEGEDRWLASLAEALGMPTERMAELEGELFT